jgi:Ni,Fe-hydrogenase III large subunit
VKASDALLETRNALAAGARFAWLFFEAVGGATRAHYVVDDAGKLHDCAGDVEGTLRSLASATPAAEWYEREAIERFDISFSELPLAATLSYPVAAEELRSYSASAEVSTVLYGPVRSGIVESARWNVGTAGEDFIDVCPSMFFKHRGLEERFEGTPLQLAPYVAEYVSGATASSHAAVFSRAVEAALGIRVPDRARAARAVLVELERIHQHLDSLAKLADDGSLSVGAAMTFAAKERVHRLLCEATGNRFARGTICVGGTRFDALSRLADACERALDEVQQQATQTVAGLVSTPSLIDRLIGTGRLDESTIRAYGAVGPVARGSHVSSDVRACDGYLYTPLDGEETREQTGDAAARALVRVGEITRSFQLIRNALDADPAGPSVVAYTPQDGSAIARVESPQGELLYFVRIESGILSRVAIRSASFANWPAFVPSLPGNIFTDFSFIEHSFGAIQAEVDR